LLLPFLVPLFKFNPDVLIYGSAVIPLFEPSDGAHAAEVIPGFDLAFPINSVPHSGSNRMESALTYEASIPA
jgi:hypothetical protein